MPEFSVVITATIAITARNMDQADERAQQITEWLDYEPPKGKPWAQGEQGVEWVVQEIDEA